MSHFACSKRSIPPEGNGVRDFNYERSVVVNTMKVERKKLAVVAMLVLAAFIAVVAFMGVPASGAYAVEREGVSQTQAEKAADANGSSQVIGDKAGVVESDVNGDKGKGEGSEDSGRDNGFIDGDDSAENEEDHDGLDEDGADEDDIEESDSDLEYPDDKEVLGSVVLDSVDDEDGDGLEGSDDEDLDDAGLDAADLDDADLDDEDLDDAGLDEDGYDDAGLDYVDLDYVDLDYVDLDYVDLDEGGYDEDDYERYLAYSYAADLGDGLTDSHRTHATEADSCVVCVKADDAALPSATSVLSKDNSNERAAGDGPRSVDAEKKPANNEPDGSSSHIASNPRDCSTVEDCSSEDQANQDLYDYSTVGDFSSANQDSYDYSSDEAIDAENGSAEELLPMDVVSLAAKNLIAFVKKADLNQGGKVLDVLEVDHASDGVLFENVSKNAVAKGFTMNTDGSLTIPQETEKGCYPVVVKALDAGASENGSQESVVAFFVVVA